MTDSRVVIETRGLEKKYGTTQAVYPLHLSVNQGECFGFLGPKGAGKTTALRMMYCASPITAGELYVLGMNAQSQPRKIKARIGVVPQEGGVDSDFTVRENLELFASYHRLPRETARRRITELLHTAKLDDHADVPVQHLLPDLTRRLALARALLNQPEILFVDEPALSSAGWLAPTLSRLKGQDKSVVLTTDRVSEAESLCDRVAIMNGGKILIEGAPKDLTELMIGREVLDFRLDAGEHTYFISRFQNKYDYQIYHHRMRLFIREHQDVREALHEVQNRELTVRKASLSDVFLKLSGHDLGA